MQDQCQATRPEGLRQRPGIGRDIGGQPVQGIDPGYQDRRGHLPATPLGGQQHGHGQRRKGISGNAVDGVRWHHDALLFTDGALGMLKAFSPLVIGSAVIGCGHSAILSLIGRRACQDGTGGTFLAVQVTVRGDVFPTPRSLQHAGDPGRLDFRMFHHEVTTGFKEAGR